MKVINSYTLPIPSLTGDVAHRAVAVLTRDDANQYAAYMAIVRRPADGMLDDWDRVRYLIAGSGTKLRFDDAVKYFPSIAKKEYRA